MKYLFLLCLMAVFSIAVQAQDKAIKSGSVTFTFVEKEVNGSISDFTSTSKIDWNNLENSVIEGQVKTETLKTGNFVRDWSLKSSKYFDTDTFPVISFKSTKIEKGSGTSITVYGTLTLKEIAKPIEIRFTKDGNTLEGTTTLFTPDFDITILKKDRAANKVVVQFHLALE